MEIMKVDNNIKITSNMIAELTGKRHDHVMRDIEIIIENIGIEEITPDLGASTYKDKANRVKPNYVLSKDGLMLVITKYSDTHRMKLIKYARSLEIKPKELSIIQVLQQSTKMLEQLHNKNIVLENKIDVDKPRVSFAETIEKSSECILIREYSKILANEGIKLGERKLYAWLRNKGYIQKNSTEPTQRAVEQGLFKVSERVVKTVKGEILSQTTKLTGKGQIFFIEKLKVTA